MKITAIDKTVLDLLSSGFYSIPRFQRPYSWEGEQVEEFWTDTVINNDASDYFIGAIVAYKAGGGVLGVVDGQQRLTTITILLAALRDGLRGIGEVDLADGIQNLIERRNLENHLQYVITTETSYPFFQKQILDGSSEAISPPGEEEELLANAFEFFKIRIGETLVAVDTDSISTRRKILEKRKRLLHIREQVLSLTTIYVEVAGEDEAYTIFETLNTRGKELSVADLVKTHLARMIRRRNRGVDDVRDTWTRIVNVIEGSAGDLSLETFVHHSWLSRNSYVSSKKLFPLFRRAVTASEAPRTLANLETDATLYRAIHDPDFRKWTKQELPLRRSLEALRLFRVTQPLPFILAILRSYFSKEIKLGAARDALEAVENFHFVSSAIASQRSSGGVSFMYASHARELSIASGSEAKVRVARRLKEKLRERRPTSDQFEAGFMSLAYSTTNTKNRRLIQYILGKIAAHHAVTLGVDPMALTIEHIAPQSSNVQRRYDIGNLIAVSDELNQRLADKAAQDKLLVLRRELPWLDATIVHAQKWDAAEITTRTKALSAAAYDKLWSF